MCASSWVKPRARVRPCTTPDFSYRYTVPNSNNRKAARGTDRPRALKIRLCMGQFIGFR